MLITHTAFRTEIIVDFFFTFFVRKLSVRVQRINIFIYFVANCARDPMFVQSLCVLIPFLLGFEVNRATFALVQQATVGT